MKHVFLPQVSENGVLSFGTRFGDPPQTIGPTLLPENSRGSFLLVAPFWTDYDYGSGGIVKLETYDTTNPGRIERMRQVSEFVVNRTAGLQVFNTSWMILVEWRDCVPKEPNVVMLLMHVT